MYINYIQLLDRDLSRREEEVDSLMSKCSQLESFMDVQAAASQLHVNLSSLKNVMGSVHGLVRERRGNLEVRMV